MAKKKTEKTESRDYEAELEKELNSDTTAEELLGEFLDSESDDTASTQKTEDNEKIKRPRFETGHAWERPPRNPYTMDRYPHTHYGAPDLSWVYGEIHTIKDWLMSLTKLHAYLQNNADADTLELTGELQKIIDKMQALVDLLAEALNTLPGAINDIDAALKTDFDYVVSLILGVNQTFTDALPYLTALFNCIENRLKVHDGYIGDINTEINNIFNSIEQIMTSDINTTSLTFGTDFTVTYLNGWTLHSDYDAPMRMTLNQEVLQGKDVAYKKSTLRAQIRASSASIAHLGELRDNVIFNHGNSPIEDGAKFIEVHMKDTATFNTILSHEQYGNDIINVSPRSSRCSWPVEVSYTASGYDPGTFCLYFASIGDGYNQQWQPEDDPETLYCTSLNSFHTFTYFSTT